MTFPVSRHAALTSLALAIATPAVFGATATDTALSPVLVTATRSATPVAEVLRDNLTISADDIARSGAGSLIDLLQRQRGIEVARNGGPGTSSAVFLRGANSNQNIVLVDGVRIGSATTGAANWSAIPLSAIDHVEIVYGPLSTMYGADALGGVIQIFTKKGEGAPRASVAAGIGSDATRQADASIAGATGGAHSFSYALAAGKERSDGFSAKIPAPKVNPDADGYDKQSANGQFALQLAKGHEIGLVFLYSRLDAQYDTSPDYDDRLRQKLENIALFSKNAIMPDWNSQFQLARARDRSGDDSKSGKSQLDTTQTDISWQHDIRIGADALQILFEHRREEVESSASAALTRERNTDSVAASYNLKRGQHLASVSLRDDDNSQYGAKATGALGYGYRFSSALRASASVGTSFRAPTFNELYYPGYGLASNKPEQGRNAEAGLYFDDGQAQWSAAYYRNRVSDLLVTATPCPFDQVNHPYGCAYNVDRAVLEGVTLSARRQFGPINLRGNLDLQDPRDDTTGKVLARRAKRHANLSAEYGAGPLNAGVELQLSGRRFDDAANKTALCGYGLLNLFATWQVAPDWSLLARWNNATGKQYTLANNYATAGSNVFVGLRYGMK